MKTLGNNILSYVLPHSLTSDYQLISFDLQFYYSLTQGNNDNNPETCTYLLLVLEFVGFEMDESQLSVRS